MATTLTASQLGASTVTGTGAVTASDPLPAGQAAQVTLTLTGQTVLQATPTDIVFVIDESGSLTATGFAQEKAFVVDLISSLGTAGLFANGGRAGAVFFSTAVNAPSPYALTGDQTLITNQVTADVYNQGFTATYKAINTATAMLSASTAGNKVIVVLTDGQQTVQGESAMLAQTNLNLAVANAQAVATVYSVGFGSNIDPAELALIASGPGNQGVFTATSSASLGDILTALVEAVSLPGGTNIQVQATVAADFAVSGVSASKGAVAVAGNTLTWTIDELAAEQATLTYSVTVPNECDLPAGEVAIHDSLTYSDNEGNVVDFGNLLVNFAGDITPPEVGYQLVGPNVNSGFFSVVASDNCCDTVQVYINGFGPFANGNVVKVTVAPGAKPKLQQKPDHVHLILNQPAVLTAVDCAGNTAEWPYPGP